MTDITFCWEASYMNYNRLSHKARCSMAPRNCPHEISEVVVLKTGKKKQIYYCTFEPQTGEAVQIPLKDLKKTTKPEKKSCRLDGT